MLLLWFSCMCLITSQCVRLSVLLCLLLPRIETLFFFFFQAEDGIRDLTVTGVQTCALPISLPRALAAPRLPLHVRARLHGGVSALLGDRGRVRRLRRPPGQPRRHTFSGVAGDRKSVV